MTIQEKFNLSSITPSDINEHIETLYNLAKECEHIRLRHSES
jgi:hypothetical protein